MNQKLCSLLLSAALLAGLLPAAAPAAAVSAPPEFSAVAAGYTLREDWGAAIPVEPEADPDVGGAHLGVADTEAAQSYVESFAAMLESPIGAAGFEGAYAPASPGERMEVIVVLSQLPSAVLPIYSRARGVAMTEARAEVIVQGAVERFLNKLSAIDPAGSAAVNSTLTLLTSAIQMTIPAHMAEAIAAIDGVFAVIPDYIVTASGTADTNALSWSPEAGYASFPGRGMDASRRTLRLDELGDAGFTGAGVTVGIIDSGVDYNHPDLYGAFSHEYVDFRQDEPTDRGASSSRGYDFVDNDNDPNETTYADWEVSGKPLTDSSGTLYYTTHGTHVAGTVAGQGIADSAYATLGVAPEARLMAYRVLGPYGNGHSSDILLALERAVIDGCDIVNMSLGGRSITAFDVSANAANNAMLKGVLVCIAAGNDGPDAYTVGSPGISFLSLTVGAAELGGEPDTRYETALVTAAGQSPTPAPVHVEGFDSATTAFQDDVITAESSLAHVEGSGYAFEVVVGANGAPTEVAHLEALPDGSMAGKILVVMRGGMSFVDVPVQAARLDAGAFLIINSSTEEGFLTNTSISGMRAGMVPFLTVAHQTGLDMIRAYDRARAAGETAYLKLGALTPAVMLSRLADFSSRGPLFSGTFAIKPDLVAPGYKILSTVPAFSASLTHDPEDYTAAYTFMNGTSMATPHVAGIAALMLQKYPGADPLEIKVRLMNAVDQLEEHESVYETGAGFVNVYRAIHGGDSYAAVTDAYLNDGGERVGAYDFGSFSFGNTTRAVGSEESLLSKALPLVITNHAETTRTYTFRTIYNNKSPQFSVSAAANGVTLSLSAASLTIPAGECATVQVSMLFPRTAAAGIYEGRLVVTDHTSGEEMTLPFAGRLGPSLDGVHVENPWLSRPTISTAPDGVISSVYATYAHVTFSFSGKSVQQRVYVTDLNDNPVAYSGRYSVAADTQIYSTYTLLSAIREKMYLYNGTGYDDVRRVIPDGVYKVWLQVIPTDTSFETQEVFVSTFVVDSTAPVLTIDQTEIIEYPNGGSTVQITGSVISEAGAQIAAHNIPAQALAGSPVVGQSLNSIWVIGAENSFVYMACDFAGNFTVNFPAAEGSRAAVVAQDIVARDLDYEWLAGFIGYEWFGNSVSNTVTVEYTETAAITHLLGAENGRVDAILSNVPVNADGGSFTVEYSTDGADFRPAAVTDYSPSGTIAAISFMPVRRTFEEQTVSLRLTYKDSPPLERADCFTVPAAQAVYTDDSGADLPIEAVVAVPGGTPGAEALAALPTEGYVFDGVDYLPVSIAWTWAGVTFDPETAGEYNALGTLSGTDIPENETIDGAVTIARAQPPEITAQPVGGTVAQGGTLTLSVTANAPDGGTLSYQWHWKSTLGGQSYAVPDATEASYTPFTTNLGTGYYSVEVTNTLNNTTAAAVSDDAQVTVSTPIAPPTPPVEPPSTSGNTGAAAESGSRSVAALKGLITAGKDLAITTGGITVTYNTRALAAIVAAAGEESTVRFAATCTTVDGHPVLDVTVTAGDTVITDLGGGLVTVSLPYTPTAEELRNPAALLVNHIDGDGNRTPIVGGYSAAAGRVEFSHGALSRFGVAFRLVTFDDTPPWACEAAIFAAARGILDFDGAFDGERAVTRGEFLVALMRAYAIDVRGADRADAFADVDADSELYAYAAVARALGITRGTDEAETRFSPHAQVSREQAAAFFVRALTAMDRLPGGDNGRTLADYTDGGSVSGWAAEPVEAVIKSGLMTSTSTLAYTFSPARTLDRSQLVQLLYNLFQGK